MALILDKKATRRIFDCLNLYQYIFITIGFPKLHQKIVVLLFQLNPSLFNMTISIFLQFHPIGISGAEMTRQSGMKAQPKLENGLGLNTPKLSIHWLQPPLGKSATSMRQVFSAEPIPKRAIILVLTKQ